MHCTSILVALALVSVAASAQTIAVKEVELAGEKIIVHYDLEDSNPGTEYHISLYSSWNNFQAALVKVTGDVGTEIRSGTDKKIEWHALEELGPFKGRLSLEVRARLHMPIVKAINISSRDKFKRNKTHNITWTTSNNNMVNIELYNGNNRVTGEFSQPNNGRFSLLIPSHARPGKNYTLRITDAHNQNESVVSGSFRVVRKVPLVLKVVPVVAAGALASLFIGNSAGGSNTIPNPPTPPNGN